MTAIISIAVIVPVGLDGGGPPEVLGMTVGHSDAKPFWVKFLRSLARHVLRGVKLAIFNAHRG